MTWPSHQIPRKLPSANPTISSLSTESERTGNYLCLVPFFSIVYILVQFEAEVLIGFLVSPRGDKKVICNKFIQTVRKRDLMHCYCLEEHAKSGSDYAFCQNVLSKLETFLSIKGIY